jgi:hypothetical protein
MQLVASFICDDIRSEEGNKVSLMGLYDESMLLPQIPAKIPKLCLFQRWSEVPVGAKVNIEVRGAPLTKQVRVEAKAEKTDDGTTRDEKVPQPTHTRANLQFLLASVDITAEGTLEFLVSWEGSAAPDHVHRIHVSVAKPAAKHKSESRAS